MHQTGVYEEPFGSVLNCERWIVDAKIQDSPFPFLSHTSLSAQNLIWTSFFLAISSSHTDRVARGLTKRERERERESEIWQPTREETSKRHATSPLPALVLTLHGVPDSRCTHALLLLCLCSNVSFTGSFEEILTDTLTDGQT